MSKETQAPEIPAEQTEAKPQDPAFDSAKWDESTWPADEEVSRVA